LGQLNRLKGNAVDPEIVIGNSLKETMTQEGCLIRECWNSEDVSVARARVKAGATTRSHHLEGVSEIYVITEGRGLIQVGKLEPTHVEAGDTVFIPPGVEQQITNVLESDLVFYCICTPRFTNDCYREKEENT
jgi:mannose-6-phosphate isomerase-like protein (cupin superfamily)